MAVDVVAIGSVTRRVALEALASFSPPPDTDPSVWAEASVYIPVGNAIPGLIRFDNAPYQRLPLDLTMDPAVSRISLMWGAQVGKTTVALCAQAFRIAENPMSQIMMQPSQGDLHVWLETKFNPMVEANSALHNRLAKPRSREGVNNQSMKKYPGGFLMFAWSGSPKTMRGRSAPFIVADETDGYDRTHEGHPVSLLWQRAATFGDQRLLLEISTPTIKGASYIEAAFDAGDQRHFHVICPHCAEVQRLRWSNVRWDKTEEGEHLPDSAGYVCEGCGVIWSDGERISAVRTAEANGAGWIADRPFRGHASFHLNELYSCFRRLADVVRSFLEKKAANDMQTFVNVALAETWEEEGDQVDGADLLTRAHPFDATVPVGVGVLTAGVDMQQDRLEVEVVGWGNAEESWSIDYRVLYGDPLRSEVWADLDALLGETFTHATGAELSIAGACLDTGGGEGLTQAAYEYARGKTGRRLFAIKGVGGWGRPVVSAPSRVRSRRARMVQLFSVGVDEAKLIVSRRFGVVEEGPGFCHIPDNRAPEWFSQATAESLRTRMARGFTVREWHKTRERNEALDCRVYAYAALKLVNPNISRLVRGLVPVSVADLDPDEDAEGGGTGNPPEEQGRAADDVGSKRVWRPRPKKARK
jgi:phage terminase large subunit GpA-like protein